MPTYNYQWHWVSKNQAVRGPTFGPRHRPAGTGQRRTLLSNCKWLQKSLRLKQLRKGRRLRQHPSCPKAVSLSPKRGRIEYQEAQGPSRKGLDLRAFSLFPGTKTTATAACPLRGVSGPSENGSEAENAALQRCLLTARSGPSRQEDPASHEGRGQTVSVLNLPDRTAGHTL